ncbi:MAG: ATP-binding protein [Candidatus Aenigmarchaeota archaeon]|nr:ATP-binding protein [Candidatus Aenigmarchaeota archaeon]
MKKEKLEEFNNWWFIKSVPQDLLRPYKRSLFNQLIRSLNNRQVISITGLRRTGKTTLMFQLIQKLLDDGVKNSSVLYFSFDEYAESLDEVINAYREAQKKDFREEGKYYIFLDEIQKLSKWENQIKKYYDLYPKVKFVISGSESLFIAEKTKETLAGRIYELVLKPMSFSEFIGLKGLGSNIPTIKIKSLFLEYLETGGFPEIIGKEKAERKEYVKSIVLDKIIFKDIVSLFGIRDTEALMQLIELISTNPGMYLDYSSLAQQLDKDRRSIKNYTILLKESFLLKIMCNYRKNSMSTLRKLKRVYPVDSSIITAFKSLIDDQFLGRIVECVIVNHTNSNHFWKNSHEVDMVVDGVPVEIKYQNKIVDKDLTGLREFMRKFSVKKGLLITKDEERQEKLEEGEISLLPAWKFCLESKL